MAAEIAIEQQRAALMNERVENDRKEADSRACALEATLKPVQSVGWRTLMMLSPQGSDPKSLIALAFQDMAANAKKIGELNISPDLLRSLLAPPGAIVTTSAPPKGR